MLAVSWGPQAVKLSVCLFHQDLRALRGVLYPRGWGKGEQPALGAPLRSGALAGGAAPLKGEQPALAVLNGLLEQPVLTIPSRDGKQPALAVSLKAEGPVGLKHVNVI